MSGLLGSKVPSELTDAIIDHLCHDKRALATCSTVCKAWLARSRHHHFEHVFLSYKDRFRVRAFFALCDSSSSTITPHIRSLHLAEGRTLLEHWIKDYLTKLTMFSSIESLILENATFALDSPMTTTFFFCFPMLRKLSVIWAYLRSFAQLVNIIGACPLLEHLSLDGLNYWNTVHHPYPSIDQQPLLNLRNLELGVCDKTAVVGWLLAGEKVLDLTKLRATSLTLDEIASIGALLGTLVASLEHLELGLDHSFHEFTADFIDEIHQRIDLSSHTRIRAIHFTEHVADFRTIASANASWIPLILSQVTASCIEELAFHILIPNLSSIEAFNWDALADVLVQTSFSRLQSVHFSVTVEGSYTGSAVHLNQPEVMDLIKRKLPTWAALGVCSM